VQVVKPGGQGVVGQHPQQQRGQFQLVQQPSQGRQVVIRQQQQQQQQFGNVIRPSGGMRPGQQQVRYVVGGRPPPQVVPVQLRPGGPVQQPMRLPPVHMARPGPPRPGGSPNRQGVIQHTVQPPHQYGSPGPQARYVQGGPGMVRQNMSPDNWRGGAGGPPNQMGRQMIRQAGPVQGGQVQQGVQQQQRQFGPQQMNTGEKIAYNVEHVFIEDGREVRKMPVEINGETIWVECVPGGGQGVQARDNRQQQVQPDQDGGIMMEIGDTDGLEIHGQGGAKTSSKPIQNNAGNIISNQFKEAIMREVLEERIPPTDLAKKYGIQPTTIRDWIKKAGHSLPKNYKRSRSSKPPPGPPGGFSRMPDLPTAPLPPGQVGVTVGDPPTIDSPPSQEGSSVSTSLSSSSSQYPGPHPPGSASKRVPGKLAMCKSCGHLSEDLSTCVRCRRKFPDDVKLLDDPAFKPKPDSTDHMAKKALRGVRLPTKNRRKANPDEPVCIALSSDEEGDDDNSRSSLVETADLSQDDPGEGSVITDANIVDGSQPGQWCQLSCRSIRIGNYKVLPKEKITITAKGVQIKVPAIINTNEVMSINIPMSDVLKVLAHFGKSMPLLFLYISPAACSRARKTLKMTNSQSFFLDVQSNDETQKRITILPEKLTEDNKAILKTHFGSNVQELESKDANEILVRSSPKDLPMLKSKMGGVSVPGSAGEKKAVEQQVVKYCQYPPDGAGNVSVTNEDYNCLEAEQFLNDVIIDFYLKFLQHGRFSNIKEVMDRTHIFTTYFYKRLTTRPSTNNKVKAHPIEDNPNLTAAQKRYERVKKWTKKVNLFEKDFIVVPINEHAHWFVCVICFPGQTGCVRADDGAPCETPPGQTRARNRQKKKSVNKKPVTIGSTTIIPLKGRGDTDNIRYTLEEDMSDRDEAEASEDETYDDEDENGSKKTEDGAAPKTAVRQPCILTFDSLTGGSKARTHQTLREYLSCEWKAKMVPNGAPEKVFSKDNMVGGCPTVQQQPNFSDCGIYLLQYVESFFRDPIVDYSLPITSIKEWFKKDEVEGKRDHIASLIRDLASKQNPGKEFSYPDLNFMNDDHGEDSDDEDDEDYEGEPRQQQQHPNLQIVGLNNSLMSISGSSSSPRLMVTPGKQGQGGMLIQRTGGKIQMQRMGSTGLAGVPAGVTVTPASANSRLALAGNNISIRKMSVVSSSNNPTHHNVSVGSSTSLGEAVQTSPDSTSHEDIVGEHIGDRDRREDSQDQEHDRSNSVPDSQGFESSKRSAEAGGFEGGSKRVKSDSSDT